MKNLIENLMTDSVIVAKPENNLNQLLQFFKQFRVNHIPVTNENDKVLGIVSTKDVLKQFEQLSSNNLDGNLSEALQKITVDAIMIKEVIKVSKNDTIDLTAKLMAQNSLGSILVTDENDILQGIVTNSDMVIYLANK